MDTFVWNGLASQVADAITLGLFKKVQYLERPECKQGMSLLQLSSICFSIKIKFVCSFFGDVFSLTCQEVNGELLGSHLAIQGSAPHKTRS